MIGEFKGEYDFLSNFYLTDIKYRSIVFPSVEHAYVAEKIHPSVGLFANPNYMETFLQLHPGAAKKVGQTDRICDSWDEKKFMIMQHLIDVKFSMNSNLAQRLLDTGDKILIEGNYWNDTYWGVCGGKGQNNLGKILMSRRNMLRLSEVFWS